MPSNFWNFSDFFQTKKVELVDSRATSTTFQPKIGKKTNSEKVSYISGNETFWHQALTTHLFSPKNVPYSSGDNLRSRKNKNLIYFGKLSFLTANIEKLLCFCKNHYILKRRWSVLFFPKNYFNLLDGL